MNVHITWNVTRRCKCLALSERKTRTFSLDYLEIKNFWGGKMEAR